MSFRIDAFFPRAGSIMRTDEKERGGERESREPLLEGK